MGLMTTGMASRCTRRSSGLIGSILLQRQYYMRDGAHGELVGRPRHRPHRVFLVPLLSRRILLSAPFCRDPRRLRRRWSKLAQANSAVAERRNAKVEGWIASSAYPRDKFDPFSRHAVQALQVVAFCSSVRCWR